MSTPKKRERRWRNAKNVDVIRSPYGDLMGDDDAMREFIRTNRHERRELKIAIGTHAKHRKMSKAAFAKWKADIWTLDDDEPLNAVLGRTTTKTPIERHTK